MKTLLRSIAWVLGLALASAQATAAMTPDPTGMWYDPDHPGWGLSVTQQGDNAFVVLFTYDANHNPAWFVASNVIDTGTVGNTLVGEIYAGALYRTTGPAFSMPSDASVLQATAVGNIQLGYMQPAGSLSVTYTIDGITVNKVVKPQTWASNSAVLTGRYDGAFNGGIFIDSTPGCQVPDLLQSIPYFNIAPGTTTDALNILWSAENNVYCTVSGTYTQTGQFGSLSGPVTCVPSAINSLPTGMGSLSVTQMTMGPGGFSGYLNYRSPLVHDSTCTVGGRIGGAQRGAPSAGFPGLSPDPTGMWYDPAHPGWGMHVTQQGGTIFAVIYVYDQTNTPRWYVASNVVDAGRTGNASDGFSGNAGELYSGPLYGTLGPYFGNDADPVSLYVATVGTLSMAYTSDNPRTLSIHYSVSGANVVKNVQPQTWLSNAAQLTGTYTGSVSIHPCACFPELCDSPISGPQVVQLSVTPGSSPSTVQLAWNLGSPIGACKYTATYSQDGQLGALQGTTACDGNSAASPLTVTNITIGPTGFAGVANLPGYCPGAIGGVRNQ